jgi:hypothetical protein
MGLEVTPLQSYLEGGLAITNCGSRGAPCQLARGGTGWRSSQSNKVGKRGVSVCYIEISDNEEEEQWE